MSQSSKPHKIVIAELKKWAEGPWNASTDGPEPLPPWPIVARLVPLLGEEVQVAASHYNWQTGLGLDQLHPKHLSLLSGQALFAIACYLYTAEITGLWAGAMQHYSFFLLHKPSGGFRTIGPLSTIYRIWARVRMPFVRQWGAGVPRAFFAAGVGKSTEQAVGSILLKAEGIKQDEEAACCILDIDKCYENVDRQRMQRAEIQHNFPSAIARLCLHMYRAWRTVAWDVFVSPRWPNRPKPLCPGAPSLYGYSSLLCLPL